MGNTHFPLTPGKASNTSDQSLILLPPAPSVLATIISKRFNDLVILHTFLKQESKGNRIANS